MPARSFLRVAASLLGAALLASACANGGTGASDSATNTGVVSDTGGRRVAGVTGQRVEVVAVGDIVCPPGARVTLRTCRQAETAELTKRMAPDAVLALGDLQYQTGTLRAFNDSYDRSWGDLKGITYPTPGNHEYRTDGARGYYTYFEGRTTDAPGYYAFDLGQWRAYSVNANCGAIDCDEQAAWLANDLTANPRRCSLIATHVPRFSTGEHGNSPSMARFFRIALRNGVDLMIAGHDHHYERYRPMDAGGRVVDRGVVQIVSGGGGKSHYAADGRAPGSAFVEDDTFGVLRLVLRPDSYRYGFRGIDGSSRDNGTRACV